MSSAPDDPAAAGSQSLQTPGGNGQMDQGQPLPWADTSRNFSGPPPWQQGFPPGYGAGGQVSSLPSSLAPHQWPPGLPDSAPFSGPSGLPGSPYPGAGVPNSSQSYGVHSLPPGSGAGASLPAGLVTMATQRGHEEPSRPSRFSEGGGPFRDAQALGVESLLKAARSQAEAGEMEKDPRWDHDRSRFPPDNHDQGYPPWIGDDYGHKEEQTSRRWNADPAEEVPYYDTDRQPRTYFPSNYDRPEGRFGRGGDDYDHNEPYRGRGNSGADPYLTDPYERGYERSYENRGRDYPEDPYSFAGGDSRSAAPPPYSSFDQLDWEQQDRPQQSAWEEPRGRLHEPFPPEDPGERGWQRESQWDHDRPGWGGRGARAADTWDPDDYAAGNDDDEEDVMSENWVPHPKSKWPLRAENFDFRLGCKSCFIKHGEGIHGYSYRPMPQHNCAQNFLLVRNKLDQGPQMVEWVHVRKRPNTTGMKFPNFDYKLCEQFQKGMACKVGTKKCTFPHHRLELRLWTMDRAGTFSIKGFIACLKRGFVNVDRERERQALARENKAKLVEEQEKVQSVISDVEKQLKDMDRKMDDLRKKRAEQQRIKDLGVADDVGLISYPMLKPKATQPTTKSEAVFSAVPPPAVAAPMASAVMPPPPVSVAPVPVAAPPTAPVAAPAMVPPPLAVSVPSMVPAPSMVPPPTSLPLPSMVPPPSSLPLPSMVPAPVGLSLPTMVPPPASLPAPTMVPPPKSLPLPTIISLPSSLPAPSLFSSSLPVPAAVPPPTLMNPASMFTSNVVPQMSLQTTLSTATSSFSAPDVSPSGSPDFLQVLSAQRAAIQQLTASQQLQPLQPASQTVLLPQPVATAPTLLEPPPLVAPMLQPPPSTQQAAAEQNSLEEQQLELERTQEMLRMQLRELTSTHSKLNQQIWQATNQPDAAWQDDDYAREKMEDFRGRAGRYRSPSPDRWRKRSRFSNRDKDRSPDRSRRSPERSRRSRSPSPRRRSPGRSRRSPPSKRSRWSSPDRSESKASKVSSPDRDRSPERSSSSSQDKDRGSRDARKERRKRRWDPSPESPDNADPPPVTDVPPPSAEVPPAPASEVDSGSKSGEADGVDEAPSSPQKSPEAVEPPAAEEVPKPAKPDAREISKADAAEMRRRFMDENILTKKMFEKIQEEIKKQQEEEKKKKEEEQRAEEEEGEEEEEEEATPVDKPRPEPLTEEEWQMAKQILQLQKTLSVLNKRKGALETLSEAHAFCGISSPLNFRCHTFVPPTGGQHKHTAFVFLGTLVLATTQVEGKKTFLKNIIYAIAVKNLKTKSAYRLAKFKYEGSIDLDELLKSDLDGAPLPSPLECGVSEPRRDFIRQKLASFHEDLVALRGSSDSDVSHGLSKVWEKKDINAAVLFLRKEYDDSDVWVECELYLEDIFVLSVESRTKKASRTTANRLLVESFCPELIQKMVESGRLLTCQDRNQSATIDFRYYNKGKMLPQEKVEDNTFVLKKLSIWPVELNRPVEELVVVETDDNRRRNAFSELLSTVSQNGMFLELDTQKKNHNYTCTVYIQMRSMGSAQESSRKAAISEACFQALQHLEDTCDVIKCRSNEDLDKITTVEDILKLASQFKRKGGEVSLETPSDKSAIMKALRHVFDGYLGEITLAALTFPYDVPSGLKDMLYSVAHEKHLDMMRCKSEGEGPSYLYVQKNRRWLLAREKLLLLQLLDNCSGRYEVQKCKQKTSPEALERVRQQYLAGLEITGMEPAPE